MNTVTHILPLSVTASLSFSVDNDLVVAVNAKGLAFVEDIRPVYAVESGTVSGALKKFIIAGGKIMTSGNRSLSLSF